MSRKIRITVLVENTAQGAGILAEHGLAYWIEWDGRRTLFDTGQGNVLASNAYKLGIPLREADAVVLSHGHYDHTGGLPEALKTSRPVTVYAHPAAFAPKYARKADGSAREIGIPHPAERAIRSLRNRLVYTDQPTPVVDRLTVTGPVPRLTDFEDTGGPFFLDQACTKPDPLEDDQSVVFDTVEGTVVLLGCALGHYQHAPIHPPVDRRPSHTGRDRRDAPRRCFRRADRADHRRTPATRSPAASAGALHGDARHRCTVDRLSHCLCRLPCGQDI